MRDRTRAEHARIRPAASRTRGGAPVTARRAAGTGSSARRAPAPSPTNTGPDERVGAEERAARPQLARRRQAVEPIRHAPGFGRRPGVDARAQDVRQRKDLVVVHRAGKPELAARELVEAVAGQVKRPAERERFVRGHVRAEIGAALRPELHGVQAPALDPAGGALELLVALRGAQRRQRGVAPGRSRRRRRSGTTPGPADRRTAARGARRSAPSPTAAPASPCPPAH